MQDDLDADDRALIAKLRELPPEGTEPDWDELEATIRASVSTRAPRPWWRNWRWIVPAWAFATTAAVALIVVRHDREAAVSLDDTVTIDAGVPAAAVAREDVNAMWLDGEVVDLEHVDEPALDDLDRDVRAALRPDDDVTGGILPVADYGWIDTLDDDAIDRAEDWLKRKRS